MTITSEKIIDWIDKNISTYMNNPVDYSISDGNVALCIIEKEGKLHGRMYGEDIDKRSNSFYYAWKKARQVLITGMKTGEFERKVFNNEINEYEFPINRPDYIGWIGGQPVELDNGEILAVGFSGFTGETDIQIVEDAIKAIKKD